MIQLTPLGGVLLYTFVGVAVLAWIGAITLGGWIVFMTGVLVILLVAYIVTRRTQNRLVGGRV